MAKTSLANLGQRLTRRIDIVERSVNQFAINIAAEIQTGLAHNTPVDTSQALSNWIIQLETPIDEPIFAHVQGEFGSTYSASSQIAIALASRALQGRENGQEIWLSNVLDYIGLLNSGSSKQAPPGYVQDEIKRGFNRAKARFKIR